MGEAFDHLHRTLTAGLLNRCLGQIPFNRDVQLSEDRIRAMRSAIERVRLNRGALCVTPEHRLSLKLKLVELHHATGQDAVLAAEGRDLRDLKYFDIMDEVDELLSHRYQLIYAMHDQTELPGCEARVNVIQALLERVQNLTPSLIDSFEVAAHTPAPQPEAYSRVRLIPGKDLDIHRTDIKIRLVDGLFADLPYSMHTFNNEKFTPEVYALIQKFVTDAETFHFDHLTAGLGRDFLKPTQLDQLLILRGMIAYGLLEHCLIQRCRIRPAS